RSCRYLRAVSRAEISLCPFYSYPQLTIDDNLPGETQGIAPGVFMACERSKRIDSHEERAHDGI
ncbi:MAG: hypothetical protein LC131_06365, partial [Anaerolineae bacterium]|nr:hypothetical protein [Anaerolineae bacterium]HNS40982.1 hypothetical protein [Promineifilum sp.]